MDYNTWSLHISNSKVRKLKRAIYCLLLVLLRSHSMKKERGQLDLNFICPLVRGLTLQ